MRISRRGPAGGDWSRVAISSGGFGPVDQSGYGCCYNPRGPAFGAGVPGSDFVRVFKVPKFFLIGSSPPDLFVQSHRHRRVCHPVAIPPPNAQPLLVSPPPSEVLHPESPGSDLAPASKEGLHRFFPPPRIAKSSFRWIRSHPTSLPPCPPSTRDTLSL